MDANHNKINNREKWKDQTHHHHFLISLSEDLSTRPRAKRASLTLFSLSHLLGSIQRQHDDKEPQTNPNLY
eukprot:scaffold1143_cov177-Amphora_coffeaeformis.AAC.11